MGDPPPHGEAVMRTRSRSAFLPIVLSLLAGASGLSRAAEGATQDRTYRDLTTLFEEFRDLNEPVLPDGVPDYSPAAMERQYRQLRALQRRLAAFDVADWPIGQQVDYHLVRAEMNGLEFYHRVMKPWQTSPDFYWGSPTSTGMPFWGFSSRQPSGEEVGDEAGSIARYGFSVRPTMPLSTDELDTYRVRLRALPRILAQGKAHIVLADARHDMGILGIRSLDEEGVLLRDLVQLMQRHHPEAVADAEAAWAAVQDYRAWIVANLHRMTAPTGVGRDDLDWWLKNVWLVPYTSAEVWAILSSRYDRSMSALELERFRNRDLRELEPAATEAEYLGGYEQAARDLIEFFRSGGYDGLASELATLDMSPPPRKAFGRESDPMDLAERVRFRFPLDEVVHENLGHQLDVLRPKEHLSVIRAARRLHEMTHTRREGFAAGLAEVLLSGGIADERPRVRELVYITAAYRDARGMGDLKFQLNEHDYAGWMRYDSDMSPFQWAIADSFTMWDHKRDAVRAPGYELAYTLGATQFEKLLTARARQLGDAFDFGAFLEQMFAAGEIPFALIRWEMTGLTDEIDRLW